MAFWNSAVTLLRTIVIALGIYLEVVFLGLMLKILAAAIFVIVYGRMLEIYLLTSLAPIPFATLGNREQSMIGQNYFRSLLALAFQGFLIMICVAIYAVLVQNYAASENLLTGVWTVFGYTGFTAGGTGGIEEKISVVILCFYSQTAP